jgi:hypothetical protein
VFFWTVIELALGVIAACLPTLRPLFTHGKSRPWTRLTSYWTSSQGTSASQSKSVNKFTKKGASKASDTRSDRVGSMTAPIVQTHIEGYELEEGRLLKAGVINVQKDVSRTIYSTG